MKRIFKCIVTIGILLILTLILNTKVEAATVTLSENKTVKKGDSVTVTAQVTAGAWNLTLSGAGKTEGLVGQTSTTSNASASKSITFIASEEGTYEIKLTGDITDYYTDETIPVNKTTKITVQKTETPKPESKPQPDPTPVPTKATLTKLVIAGKTYKNPAKSITVKVDNDVTSAKITPTTSNGESYKINKDNPVKLEEGTNTVKITLASGNVYTVYIRRAAAEDDTPNIIDEETNKEDEKVTLKSLLVKGVRSDDEKIELSYTPEFSAEVYEYKMLLDETLSDITKLDIEAVASKEEFTVEIAGNEELKDGENIVTITVKSKDGNITATYKIIVTKEAKAMPISATTVEVEQEIVSPRWNTTQKILITVFTSIIAMMGIMYAVIEYRYTNKKEDSGEDIVEYSFGKIGFKKEDEEGTKDNTENFETNVEEAQEEGFEKIDPEKIMQEDEKMTFEKIEQKDDTKKMQENTDLEFEKIEEEKPRKNKGKHF